MAPWTRPFRSAWSTTCALLRLVVEDVRAVLHDPHDVVAFRPLHDVALRVEADLPDRRVELERVHRGGDLRALGDAGLGEPLEERLRRRVAEHRVRAGLL